MTDRVLGRKCKTVSFDLTDEIELDLMRYAESRGMFSRYVKRLIQKDKVGLNEARMGIVFDDIEENSDDLDDALLLEMELELQESGDNGDELGGFI